MKKFLTLLCLLPSLAWSATIDLGTLTDGQKVSFCSDVGAITSSTTGLTGATQITNIVAITTAGYAAIVAPDASTIYHITDALPTLSGAMTLEENASIRLDSVLSADGKYTGTTMTGTSGYSQAFGDPVQLDVTSGRWEAVSVSAAAAAVGDARTLLAMVVSTGTDGNACTVLMQGTIRADANYPTLTVGSPVYATTSGDVTLTQPSTTGHVIRIIGHALDANTVFFNPDNDFITHD